MIQLSYRVSHIQDIEKAISYFKRSYFPYKENGFFRISSPQNAPIWIHGILQALAEAFPSTPITGLNTASSIEGNAMRDNETVITLQILHKSQVQVYSYDLTDTPLSSVASLCLSQLKNLPHLMGVEILYAQKEEKEQPQDLQPLLDTLSQLPISIPVWGGYSDTSRDGETTYIFTKEHLYTAGLIVIAYCGDIQIQIQDSMGWQPLGKLMTVTAMDGPMVIKEIDHKPAVYFYEKYLQYTNFKNKTLPFPLMHDKYGFTHAHMPMDATKDGGLCFNTVNYEGDQLRLSYGDPGAILQDSQKIFHAIQHFSPEGLHITSCNTRRMFLKSDANKILEVYSQVAPSSGGYVSGEIFRNGRKIVASNMMLIITAFREGIPQENHKPIVIDEEFQLDDSLSTLQHLATFIKVAMNELEETMNQLSFAASHDTFTGLLNRSAIETLLEKNMLESNTHHRPFSAIMIDVDFFKQVNDLCGHDIGDHVLLKVSQAMEEHIRPTDFAGRWGGDEFVILLPGQSLETARKIAERLRHHIHFADILPDHTPITASFGVTTSIPGENEQAFYKRMDNALYMAKEAGKNQVILLNPENQMPTLVGHT